MDMDRLRSGLMACVVSLLIWGTGGCHKHEHSGKDKDKAQESQEKTAQVTVWGERYEIFLEHRFIVAGEPVKFVTHVTDLKTLHPRREGPATFVLQLGTEPPIVKVDPTPARAGIYTPELVFPKAGEWSVSLKIPTESGESTVKLPPFKVFASKDEAAKAPEAEAPEGISFLKEQQWKLLTRTDPVGQHKVVERLRLSGVVAAKPGSRAVVAPSAAGQLLPPKDGTLPIVGSSVLAGKLLALIQPPVTGADLLTISANQFQVKAMETEFAVKFAEVEANAIKERVAVEQAKAALERVQKLFAEQAKSKREVEEAQFALRTAEANLASAEAMKKTYDQARDRLAAIPQARDLQNGFPPIELKAPISGVVTQVAFAAGEHVPADKAVVTILDPSRVLIEARVPESQLPRLGASRDAAYQVPGHKGVYVAVREGGGKLVYAGQEVDAATRTVPLVYEVPNPDGRLKVGMALDLYVETQRQEQALAVPESAIVDEDGRAVVFVMVSGETFEKRELTLGIRDNGLVQVLDGLAQGERVVTKGAYAVRLSSVSSSIPAHGHAH